jgi:exodeoxyribonuclease-3
VKIATWNVNGIRARSAQVLEFVQREAPDALCLQEIKASAENVPEPLRGLPDYWALWHGHKGYSGVALLLRKATFPARPRFSHPEFDRETRIVAARLGDLLLASVYVPNGNKDLQAKLRFLEAMEGYAAAARAEGARLVLCGDLNVALEERDVHPTMRGADVIGQTPHERALLAKIIGHGLVDLQRRFAPDDDRLYTWWAPWRNLRQRNMGWRLDYVLANSALAEKAKSCVGFREFGSSDHGPVQAVFEVEAPRYEGAPEPEIAQPPPAPPGQLPLL